MQKMVFPIGPHLNMQWMVRLVMLLALCAFCIAFVAPGKDGVKDDGWVFHQTVNNVDFYHMLANCDGKKVVLLKFNNRNNHKVKVSWKEAFDTQFKKGEEGFAGKKILTVAPGETFASGCGDSRYKDLLIMPAQVSPTYIAEISAFEFKELKVSSAL